MKLIRKFIPVGILAILFSISFCESAHMENVKEKKLQYTNHLINENSPYLLSHAHNPVNWYPWGEEAIAKAKAEDKPIFLSIGYSACHWCHVMERESFENEEIAKLLNDNFISIKVDREQRPDIDQIYMSFTTAMTGRGGWPMSVFLTPDLKPFYAGTYFPPENRYGRPGFKQILSQISQQYRNNRNKIINSAENIFDQISLKLQGDNSTAIINKSIIKKTAEMLIANVDNVYGGIGGPPKFPHAIELGLLLRHFNQTKDSTYLEAVEVSLNGMADGGIYDHIGGGFARYSTDAKWLVPHFEKMLYDNALLVQLYADAYLVTGNKKYKDVVTGTLDFVLRELSDRSGGFCSALDADSEGEEGKFYVWTKDEIDKTLGENSKLFCDYYNVSQAGNFEGKNILHLTNISHQIKEHQNKSQFEDFIQKAKYKLLEKRSSRIRPLTDDKILTSWNGLMLSAFCRGYQISGDKRYLDAALTNAFFIKDELFKNNKLTHAYRKGVHSSGQFLEDYAFLIKGLLDLFETDNSANNFKWLNFAESLADNAINLFQDETGRFYLRDANQSDLIIRPKDETDDALPAPGSILIQSLFKLHRLTDNKKYLTKAELGLDALSGQINRYPASMTSAVIAIDYYLNDKIEIIIVGNKEKRKLMLDMLYQQYLPNRIIAFSDNGETGSPLFKMRSTENGQATAYVCVNSACKFPVSDKESLRKQLSDL